MKNKKELKKQITEKEYLTNLLEQFTKLQIASKDKIEKYQSLMSRKSVATLQKKKKDQMENRLRQAQLEYSQSFEIIDQITIKLSQL